MILAINQWEEKTLPLSLLLKQNRSFESVTAQHSMGPKCSLSVAVGSKCYSWKCNSAPSEVFCREIIKLTLKCYSLRMDSWLVVILVSWLPWTLQVYQLARWCRLSVLCEINVVVFSRQADSKLREEEKRALRYLETRRDCNSVQAVSIAPDHDGVSWSCVMWQQYVQTKQTSFFSCHLAREGMTVVQVQQ